MFFSAALGRRNIHISQKKKKVAYFHMLQKRSLIFQQTQLFVAVNAKLTILFC
jgi:hypothetical protein